MIFDLTKTFFSWAVILPALFLSGSYFRPFVRTEHVILRGVLYCALGMACVSYGVVVLSAFHILHPTAIWILLIALLLLRFQSFGDFLSWLKAVFAEFNPGNGKWAFVLMLFFAASFLAVAAGSLSPEIGGDALTYHLNLPKVALAKGSIAPDDFDLNSYLPMFLNNLYLAGLATGGVLTAKLFHLFCGLLLFFAVKGVIFEELKNTFLASFFALVVWLTPTAFNILSTAYTDVGLAFYVFLAFYTLLEAFKQLNWKTFLLSGLLIGCAMALKYIAMVSFAGLLAVWGLELIKNRNLIAYAQNFLIWLLGFAIGCGYWLVRNWILTGNPVFPFFASLFGTESLTTHYEFYGLGKGFFDFASIFWNMFHTPNAFGSFGSRVGVFYFLFLPFVVLAAFFAPRSRSYVAFSIAFLIAWFYICQAHRYALPVLPMMSTAGAFGVHWCYKMASTRTANIIRLWAGSAGMALLSVYLAAGVFHYRYSYLLFLGYWSPETYLRKMERTIPMARWINANAPEDAKILIESEPRQFYFDRPVIREVFFRHRTDYGQKKLNPEALHDFLKSFGITHIVTNELLGAAREEKKAEPLKSLLRKPFTEEIYSVQSENIRDEQYLYHFYKLN